MKILIVVPAYNEEKIIAANLRILHDYCQQHLASHNWLIVLADNNSQDQTQKIGLELGQKYSQINYLFVPQKGKGIAVITAWQKYLADFEVFIFMDADLATDLSALPLLLLSIESGDDLALGSRYLAESQVIRSPFRQLFSFSYRLFLRLFLSTKVQDFPCGFKAVTQKVVANIVPKIKNQAWFFDSELVYLAEKAGYKIKEVPVKWLEPREKDTRVNLWKVSSQYLKEIWRLKWQKR